MSNKKSIWDDDDDDDDDTSSTKLGEEFDAFSSNKPSQSKKLAGIKFSLDSDDDEEEEKKEELDEWELAINKKLAQKSKPTTTATTTTKPTKQFEFPTPKPEPKVAKTKAAEPKAKKTEAKAKATESTPKAAAKAAKAKAVTIVVGSTPQKPLDPKAEKILQQKLVESSDMDNTKDLFSGINEANVNLSNDPLDLTLSSEADYIKFAERITKTAFKTKQKNTVYLSFLRALVREISVKLEPEDCKEISRIANVIANDKIASEKKSKKKTTKKTLNTNDKLEDDDVWDEMEFIE
eukprot:TRINITY_DN117_c1_g3_i2.p1 TRINITY_DN117_c1_g3~~TRINITY_DN117_c1_g3_i2.p1  ORF type:complete len:293 (+),score=188.04 TRINITY_DN117_c1_g3_i2:121-999(+)